MSDFKSGHTPTKGDFILLCDFEFKNESLNGLDVITELNLSSNAYLISSRTGEANVKQGCDEHQIQFMSKNMAALVPIHFETSQHNIKTDCILIDDQDLIRTSWKMLAKMN